MTVSQKNFMRMLREEEIPYKEEKNDFPRMR